MARPLGRQSWVVDSVTAEQERNNFMDVDTEQQTLTERAEITGSSLDLCGEGGKKRW